MPGEEGKPRRFKIASGPRLRRILLALVALASVAVGIVTYATDVLKPQERSTIDTRFSIRGTQPRPKNIVIVKVDSTTFNDLNLLWPFPRAVHAKVLSHVVAQHPAAVAYDVQFSEASSGNQNQQDADEVPLLNAIQSSKGRVVLSTTETDAHGGFRFLGSAKGAKLLSLVRGHAGNGLFPSEPEGFDRRVAYSIGHLKSLAVETAEIATKKHIKPFNSPHWIDFQGPSDTFSSISFSTVYRNRIPKNFFRDKIVVIGATAPTLQDIHPTPTDPLMSGPEVQANAIYTVLHDFPLRSTPGWVNIVLIVLLGVVVPAGSLRLGPAMATLVALGIAALFVVGTQLAFNSGWIDTFLYPLIALVLSAAGSLAVQLVTEAFERLRVRDLFTRFVPEDVVDEVLASSDGLRLGGVQREGTVMFSDVRGFTSLAESLSPAQVIDLLNHYLSEMSDAILDHGGTLVAYMGDGIFAVFGAPLPQADHGDRALAAAREMLSVRLPRFNAWLKSEGLSDGVRMGIGLNSGQVMSGHVGSERRVEYTAVGDTTNTASRIEALTKGTPHQLFLSGLTREALTQPPDDLVHVGETEIRGRVAKLELWTVGAEAAEPGKEPESDLVQATPPAV